MLIKKLNNNLYFVRIDKNEEVVSSLKQFCTKEKILCGTISGIGATNNVTLNIFNLQTKKYEQKKLTNTLEITSLNGNISQLDKKPYLHLHINLSDDKLICYGGHLTECYISVTCEIFIYTSKTSLYRELDKNIGINLIKK